MTISSTVRKAGPFAGNDVTTAFPFTFKVFSAADVLVIRADANMAEYTLELTTDYTVSLNANQNTSPGGTVTKNTALATGDSLVITSTVGNLQPVDLTNGGGFYPDVINSALDRATIQIQQLDEKVDRSIKVTITSDLTPDEFVTQLQQGASEAAASATAAAESAALAATFVPAGYAQLAGADFTGPVSSADLLTANGGVALPVDATGNNARRANQLIWNVGGAARLPTWTTAGRPATPADGDTGFNTGLNCNETWHATYSDWVQESGSNSASVALAGTSTEISGIPAWANEVELVYRAVSTTSSGIPLIRVGDGALVTTGYSGGGANVFGTNTTSTNSTILGLSIPSQSAGAARTGVARWKRLNGNEWVGVNVTGDVNASSQTGGTSITLTGALDRIGIGISGADSFDGSGLMTAYWRA